MPHVVHQAATSALAGKLKPSRSFQLTDPLDVDRRRSLQAFKGKWYQILAPTPASQAWRTLAESDTVTYPQ